MTQYKYIGQVPGLYIFRASDSPKMKSFLSLEYAVKELKDDIAVPRAIPGLEGFFRRGYSDGSDWKGHYRPDERWDQQETIEYDKGYLLGLLVKNAWAEQPTEREL